MVTTRYAKCVKVDLNRSILDLEGDKCFRISINLTKKLKEKLLIIGRNPKRIDGNRGNDTIKRIIKYLVINDDMLENIGIIEFVNIFPLYDYKVDGNDFSIESKEEFLQNNEIIKESIMSSSKIILAWGEPIKHHVDLYKERIENILRILRQWRNESYEEKKIYSVGEFSYRGYPKHPLAWSYKDNLKEY